MVRRAEEQAAASDRMAIASHRLNILAALFFPIATLGAIFGTTLTENWSLSNSTLPFAVFCITGLVTGMVLAAVITRSAH